MMDQHITAKAVLLGEGRVGKTSLLLRFVHQTFDDRTSPTVQASFFDKRITIGATTCKLAIWDTAGQERFHALGPIYYRDADAAILVYDITDQDSFVKVQNWIRELRRMVGHDIVLVIAGNKCDMERQRQVTLEDAHAYAASQGAFHYETSAKHNIGIDDLFLDLTTRLVEVKALSEAPPLMSGERVDIYDAPPEPRRKQGCC